MWIIVILGWFVLVVAVFVGGNLIARRRGYKFGDDVVVRCREGHLFTTIWVPGVSFKSVRLGTARWQRCPVGGNWTVVKQVRDVDLTGDEQAAAAQHHDVRIL
jgi:hypothetical protein